MNYETILQNVLALAEEADVQEKLVSDSTISQAISEFSDGLYSQSLYAMGVVLPSLCARFAAAGNVDQNSGFKMEGGNVAFSVSIGPEWHAVAVVTPHKGEGKSKGFVSALYTGKEGDFSAFKVLAVSFLPECPQSLLDTVSRDLEEAVAVAEEMKDYAGPFRPGLNDVVDTFKERPNAPYGSDSASIRLRRLDGKNATHLLTLHAPDFVVWNEYATSARLLVELGASGHLAPNYPAWNNVFPSTMPAPEVADALALDGGFYGHNSRRLDAILRLTCETKRMLPAVETAFSLHEQVVQSGWVWPEARLVHGDGDCGVFALPCAEEGVSALVLERGSCKELLLLHRHPDGEPSRVTAILLFQTLDHLDECWFPGTVADSMMVSNTLRSENPLADVPRLCVASAASLLAKGLSNALPRPQSGILLGTSLLGTSPQAIQEVLEYGSEWVFNVRLAMRTVQAVKNGDERQFGAEVKSGFDSYDYGKQEMAPGFGAR